MDVLDDLAVVDLVGPSSAERVVTARVAGSDDHKLSALGAASEFALGLGIRGVVYRTRPRKVWEDHLPARYHHLTRRSGDPFELAPRLRDVASGADRFSDPLSAPVSPDQIVCARFDS